MSEGKPPVPGNVLTDSMAEDLLELIWIAITEYGSCNDMRLSDFAFDILTSMNAASNRASTLNTLIQEYLA